MSNLNDKLTTLQYARDDIKVALTEKGQVVNDDIRTYANAVSNIQGSVELNIYNQIVEPVNKNGLWLKSNVDIDEVITDDNVRLDPYWDSAITSNVAATPYSFDGGGIIGNSVYLFGRSSYSTDNAYRYDFSTNTYTKLENIPYTPRYGSRSIVVEGTNIHILGGANGSHGNTDHYKYDTLTDTYTQLASYPDGISGKRGVAVGNDLYFLGNYMYYAQKYNGTTNSFSGIAQCPNSIENGCGVAIGTDIYWFYNTYAYKYDTLLNTYTQLEDVPFAFTNGSATLYNGEIYLINDDNTKLVFYKYNVDTDSYTEYDTYPTRIATKIPALKDNSIILFGTAIAGVTFPAKNYTNKSLVIENGNTYSTNLITTDVTNGLPYKFKNFYYYTTTSGFDTTIEKYVGDGTTWNKIN